MRDIGYAEEFGYRIKLLGIAARGENGIEQRVHPCLVSAEAAIANVDGVLNAVVVEGDAVGRAVLEGRGAGAGPTASAVAADIVDIARGFRPPIFGVPARALADLVPSPMADHRGAYYVRLSVVDRPGVLATVAALLGEHGISIESVLQRGARPRGAGGGGDHHARDPRERSLRRPGGDRAAGCRGRAAVFHPD